MPSKIGLCEVPSIIGIYECIAKEDWAFVSYQVDMGFCERPNSCFGNMLDE